MVGKSCDFVNVLRDNVDDPTHKECKKTLIIIFVVACIACMIPNKLKHTIYRQPVVTVVEEKRW